MPRMLRDCGEVARPPFLLKKGKAYPYAYAGQHNVHKATAETNTQRRGLPPPRNHQLRLRRRVAVSAYLNSLKNAITSAEARGNEVDDLKARVQAWFDGLPVFTRHRPYSMSEIEMALKRPGCLLSPALLALGWQRKRRWSSRAHYHRYWVPPPPVRRRAAKPSHIS